MSELFLLRIQTRLKGKLTACYFAMGLSFYYYTNYISKVIAPVILYPSVTWK